MVIIYPTTMQHPRYYQTIMNGMANKYSTPQYHLFVIKYVRDREKEREMGVSFVTHSKVVYAH